MLSNFDLQLQLQTMSETPSETQKEANSNLAVDLNADKNTWTGAFNTSLLTTRAQTLKDKSADLTSLMTTTEFECLLLAAQYLASKENLSAEEATERLIQVFRQIDHSWKQIVISRGLKSLAESN